MRVALLLWTVLTITIPAVVALRSEIGSGKDQNNNNNENRMLLPDVDREEIKRKERGVVRQFPTESQLAKDQIIQDFRHLQLLNNQVREGAAHQDANYKSLIKPLGEMKKRATRLKSNLALTAIDIEKESPEKDPDLQSLLVRLNQSVNSFVHNPMFRNTQVIDVALSKVARGDLERIIELSTMIRDRIRKGSR
jgi:hypothetical protein